MFSLKNKKNDNGRDNLNERASIKKDDKVPPNNKPRTLDWCCLRGKQRIEPVNDVILNKTTSNIDLSIANDSKVPLSNRIRNFCSCLERKPINADIIGKTKFEDLDYPDKPFIIQISNISDNQNEKYKVLEKCKSYGDITEQCFDNDGNLFVSYKDIKDAVKLVKRESLVISAEDCRRFFKRKVYPIRSKSGSLHRKIKLVIVKDKYEQKKHEDLVGILIETEKIKLDYRIETLDYSLNNNIEIVVINDKAEFEIEKIRKKWESLKEKKLYSEVISIDRIEMCDSVCVEYGGNVKDYDYFYSRFVLTADEMGCKLIDKKEKFKFKRNSKDIKCAILKFNNELFVEYLADVGKFEEYNVSFLYQNFDRVAYAYKLRQKEDQKVNKFERPLENYSTHVTTETMRPPTRLKTSKRKTWPQEFQNFTFILVETLLSRYDHSDAAVTLHNHDLEPFDDVSADIIEKAGIEFEYHEDEQFTVMSTPGTDKWKYIFHIILPEKPERNKSYRDYIQNYITECLKQADNKQLKSISFPLLDFKRIFENVDHFNDIDANDDNENKTIDDTTIFLYMLESIRNTFQNNQMISLNTINFVEKNALGFKKVLTKERKKDFHPELNETENL